MDNKSNIAILWFRRDLRLEDNPAFNWVCEHSDAVLPIYIHAPDEEQPWAPGGASRWWLHHSLLELDKKLQHHGLSLHFFSGGSETVLKNIIKQTRAGWLVFNKLYDPQLVSRDEDLQQKLAEKITVEAFDSGLLFTPGTVLNNQQLPYKVFTPFYRKIRPLISETDSSQPAAITKDKLPQLVPLNVDFDVPLTSLNLLGQHRWHDKLGRYWQPGEDNAFRLLDHFVDEALYHYQTERDIPAVEGTSRLSPYLHFGEITPRQIYSTLQPALNDVSGGKDIASAEVFLKQLAWREFAHHVLWHYPHTATQPMNPRFKNTFWHRDEKNLVAWQRGETGVAMVDAGMKQLWETGWMHNRVRMIVSSFLTKNLGLHWMEGAQWFWDTLVDADLANNSMGWQWVAGCGVDAAPYYRIFNPETQATRFDAKNQYIEKWVPDYHERSGIVDLKVSRERALERYHQQVKSQD